MVSPFSEALPLRTSTTWNWLRFPGTGAAMTACELDKTHRPSSILWSTNCWTYLETIQGRRNWQWYRRRFRTRTFRKMLGRNWTHCWWHWSRNGKTVQFNWSTWLLQPRWMLWIDTSNQANTQNECLSHILPPTHIKVDYFLLLFSSSTKGVKVAWTHYHYHSCKITSPHCTITLK